MDTFETPKDSTQNKVAVVAVYRIFYLPKSIETNF